MVPEKSRGTNGTGELGGTNGTGKLVGTWYQETPGGQMVPESSEGQTKRRRQDRQAGRTIAKLRKTCEEVSKRRKKKQRREKRLGRNEANRESSLYWWES